jgi:hypothetical protein
MEACQGIPGDLPGQLRSTIPSVSSTPWRERRIVGITFALHYKRQRRLSRTESATTLWREVNMTKTRFSTLVGTRPPILGGFPRAVRHLLSSLSRERQLSFVRGIP